MFQQPVAAWPSLAAPGVSLCGKARGSEGGRLPYMRADAIMYKLKCRFFL